MFGSGETYEVVFYESPRGECFAKEFYYGLAEKVQGKVLRWIRALAIQGPMLPRPYADVVRGKIRELRIVFSGQQYRFLYFFAGKRIVLTHGFLKKTGSVPPEELDRAERLMRDWLSRQAGA